MKDKKTDFKKAAFAGLVAMLGYALFGPIGAVAALAVFLLM